jgi:hypothetical protein
MCETQSVYLKHLSVSQGKCLLLAIEGGKRLTFVNITCHNSVRKYRVTLYGRNLS